MFRQNRHPRIIFSLLVAVLLLYMYAQVFMPGADKTFVYSSGIDGCSLGYVYIDQSTCVSSQIAFIGFPIVFNQQGIGLIYNLIGLFVDLALLGVVVALLIRYGKR